MVGSLAPLAGTWHPQGVPLRWLERHYGLVERSARLP